MSQRLGVISCLLKGDKPITLFNEFYKLIFGCLSLRIKSTLDLLRLVLCRVYTLVKITDLYMILCLIQKSTISIHCSCIDSISWPFIYMVLLFWGFENPSIKWERILTISFKATVFFLSV